jgi:hypothetical protein
MSTGTTVFRASSALPPMYTIEATVTSNDHTIPDESATGYKR